MFATGDGDRGDRFRLVHLAIAEEGKDSALRCVSESALLQVLPEPRVHHRGQRTESHRDGRVLPELGHQPRMRVGRQAYSIGLLPEVAQLLLVQPAIEEGSSVDAGAGVALDVDCIADAVVLLAPEDVVEADLVERRARGIGGDVAPDTIEASVGVGHRDRRVPQYCVLDRLFQPQVAWVGRLLLDWDGIDVGGLRGRSDWDGQGVRLGHQLM